MREKLIVLLTCLLAFCFYGSTGHAFDPSKDLTLRGYLESSNLFRTKNFGDHPDWIQNRNTFQLEYIADLVKNRYFLDDLTLTGVFRAWYDGAYDYGEAQKPAGVPGDAGFGIREDMDFRELNLVGNAGNLWFKLGRQQIAWGETDFFRLADIINPIDLSYHFIFEDLQDYRIPLWMANIIYRVGNIGPLRDTAVEFVFNPGDIEVNNLGIFPMPWALAPPGFENLAQDLPTRWASESFEYGERFMFSVGPTNWHLSHFYGYKQEATLNLSNFHLVYPKQNTFGAVLDYENDYTGVVLRVEANYIPDKLMGVDTSRPAGLALLAQHPNGMLEKDEFKYCIGLDRPTWIRWLNREQTFFITAQVFMTHVLDHEDGITNDGAPVKSVDPIYTIVVNTNYLNSRLTPQVFAAYRGEGDGLIVGGSIKHYVFDPDHFSYTIGFNSISGRDGPYAGFGALRANDEFYVRLRYSF